jgi:hypothetical protein
MTVGIPGTGLGGLFYFALVVMMPFRELVLTVRRRSSIARWRCVAFHLSILGGMLAVLWAEGWLLNRVLDLRAAVAAGGKGGGYEPARALFLQTGQIAAVTSIVVLATLLGGVALLRLTPLGRLPRAANGPHGDGVAASAAAASTSP